MMLAAEAPAGEHLDFVGADPIFPTPMRMGELGAAVIGAAALQAARLWQLRTGRMQSVRVEVDAAALAMRASRYIRREVSPGVTEPFEVDRRASVGGARTMFPTRDGRWFYFQRLFEHHRLRTAGVLKCSEDDEETSRAVAGWDALALEDAIVKAGATGGMVRSYEEWNVHPQAQAIERLPLFEIIKVGDSPAEPLPAGPRPLSGVRVLDVTRVLAGPTCGRTLAEHGAEVLRIGTPLYPDNDLMMRDTGHGKRSAILDLTKPSEAEQLRTLIRGADVISQGYRPGTLAARGFGVDEVMKLRPGIIYVTLSAFGHEGPWRERRGFDSVVQAVSGIAHEGTTNGTPRGTPANVLDYGTGYLAAFAAMVALGRRTREGGSYLVRVSLAQTGRWLSSMPRVGWDVIAACPPELTPERLDTLMISRDTPFGRLRYVGPAAQLSETPGRWDYPTAPLDNNPAVWP
jgi:crotonobetainyl-CoA:carnitine CoA-transferase CaiB-like acyl-CoA transferase